MQNLHISFYTVIKHNYKIIITINTECLVINNLFKINQHFYLRSFVFYIRNKSNKSLDIVLSITVV